MVYKKQYFINLTYRGKTYNSLNRFALNNHADFRQVYRNYHRGIRNPEHLLMSSPWIYDIHALGLLIISEVAEKTNLPSTLLYSTLHNILKNPGSTRLGLTENDIVALNELKLSYVPKNPKYVFKQSVLNHIEAYGSKLAHSKLLVIPQLMPIYLYDLQKHELWSSTHGAQGIYRKRNTDKRGYYQVSLVSNDKISYRIKAEEIEDLIAYPTIYAKDLVTRKVILDSIPDCFNKPYSGKTVYINLVKKMFEQKKHKRFDTSLLKSGHSCSATVYGVTKAEARAIIKIATRKAQKQAEESKKQRDIKFKALLSKRKRQRERQKQSRKAAKWVKAQKKNKAVKKNKQN